MFNTGIRSRGGITVKIAPTQAGVPDRLVLLPGRPAQLVELKAEAGHLSQIQVVWHSRAASIGHTVVTLTGRDEIAAWLTSLDLAARPPEVSPTR